MSDTGNPAFMAVVLNVTDPSWIESYVPAVDAIMARHGGKPTIVSAQVELLEGNNLPSQVAVFQFPDMESLKGFMDDPDYAPWKTARQAGSNASIFAFNALT